MSKRLRAALLLRYLDEQYQTSIFNAISQEARRQDLDLICIQGNTAPSGERLDLENRLFVISQHTRMDGILILSSAITDSKPTASLANIPATFNNLPCVSLGYEVQGMTSITIPSRKPMATLLDHLILDHGYRRFLFIGGSRIHHDSTVREQVFHASLKSYRDRFPELSGEVGYGNFLEETAFRLVKERMESRPHDYLDAIVAGNDNMALGALKALRLGNDPRWTACAVTGFDDIPQAATEIPALTSIHQPLDEMGRLGVQILLDRIRGKTCKHIWRIDSRLVIRNSCGCSASPVSENRAGLPGQTRPGPETGPNPPGPSALAQGAATSPDMVAELNQRIARIQRRNLESERRLSLVNTLGQNLTSAMDLYAVVQEMSHFLRNLNVRTCYFIRYETDLRTLRQFSSPIRLMYSRSDDRDSLFGRQGIAMTFDDFMQSHATREDQPSTMTIHHLVSGQEMLGMLVYDVETWAHPFMCTMATHVANSIKRVQILEEQAQRARKLESEVNIRTRDLRLINSLLEQEIRQRTQIEVELRRSRKSLDTILEAMPTPLIVFLREGGQILYTNKAFAGLSALSIKEGKAIQDYLDIPQPCEGRELNFQLGDDLRDDLPVLVHTAPIHYEDKDCLIAALVDLSRQKTLEADVLRISEYERRRFGLDLHDDICQRLAGISMYSKVIKERLPEGSGLAAKDLDELSDMVGDTLTQTRMYAHASFPVDLQNLGLDGVVHELCDQVMLQSGKPCTLESSLGSEHSVLNPEQEINIYRIIQEAVQNATKHARASQIRISMAMEGHHCEIRVKDDGKNGFARNARQMSTAMMQTTRSRDHFARGMGMRSMTYRASQLGGRLWLEENPGGGTVVCLSVPLHR